MGVYKHVFIILFLIVMGFLLLNMFMSCLIIIITDKGCKVMFVLFF